MNIVVAESAGFCYGVKNAVEKTKKALAENKIVYSLDMLVHNERVIEELKEQGLKIVSELSSVPYHSTILVRAHGVSKDTIQEYRERELNIIDLTCKNVKRIHEIVYKYSKDGYKIIIVGDKDHAEIKGIIGWIDR